MAEPQTPLVPFGNSAESENAAVQRHWRMPLRLSSIAERIEQFLGSSGFDRAPWLAVAFAGGIASWFVLDTPWQWSAAIGSAVLFALAAFALRSSALDTVDLQHLRLALVSLGLFFAAGLATIWLRSETVGAQAYAFPKVERLQGYVLEREDRPAEDRSRLTLAIRDA